MWKINHFFTSLCPKSVENTLHKISKVLFYSRGWSYLFLPYLYTCLGFKLNDPDTYGSYKKYFRFFTNFRGWSFPLLPYLFSHFFMLSMKEAWLILNIVIGVDHVDRTYINFVIYWFFLLGLLKRKISFNLSIYIYLRE